MKVLLALLCIVAAVFGQTTIYARAVIQPLGTTPSGVSGYVLFSQLSTGGNVTVTVNITGLTNLPDGPHGIHVHNFGDLSDLALGNSAGGHWNPSGAAHGCPEYNATRHYGDMGNWMAMGGSVVQTKSLDLLNLTGSNSIIGRAVVVHNLTDDCVQYINGAAGTRLAMGVIGIVNSTGFGGSGEANQANTVTVAQCYLQPTATHNVTGYVYLFQPGGTGPTTVLAAVTGITGPHGFHLHWWGDVSNPAGTATGLHYNPAGVTHGIPPFTPRHLGDMGIISFMDATSGVSYYNYTNDMISLNGVNNVIGRAMHIHANSDDCSNPVGNGGARLAQCVIGVVNNTVSTMLPGFNFPAGVPSTQNGTSICALISTSSSMSMSMSSSMTTSSTMSTTTSSSQSASASTNSVAQLAISAVLLVAAIMVASL